MTIANENKRAEEIATRWAEVIEGLEASRYRYAALPANKDAEEEDSSEAVSFWLTLHALETAIIYREPLTHFAQEKEYAGVEVLFEPDAVAKITWNGSASSVTLEVVLGDEWSSRRVSAPALVVALQAIAEN